MSNPFSNKNDLTHRTNTVFQFGDMIEQFLIPALEIRAYFYVMFEFLPIISFHAPI